MSKNIREEIEREEIKLLTYPLATKSSKSLGRARRERKDPIRPCFERDAHRILYSTAFRRLRYKTQVFFNPEHDHISTRVDHSLFVASISRTVARALGLNSDLAYAIALGHDVGHGPFGHAGEKIIQDLIQEIDRESSFQHEIHGLRVVDKLTLQPSTKKHGLNLTYEVRDGIVCHCGENMEQYISPRGKRERWDLSEIKKKGERPFTVEACVVRMVDRIACVGRDIEDATLVLTPRPTPPKLLGSTNRSIINTLVNDLINESNKQSNKEQGIVGFSGKVYAALKELYEYNMEKIYEHEKIKDYTEKAKEIMKKIFKNARDELGYKSSNEYGKCDAKDPIPVQELHEFIKSIYDEDEKGSISSIQIIIDYLSLMTDRFALKMFEHLAIPEPIG